MSLLPVAYVGVVLGVMVAHVPIHRLGGSVPVEHEVLEGHGGFLVALRGPHGTERQAAGTRRR
jgi:hypothetical protein